MLSSFKFPKAQLCHSYWPTFSSEKYEKPLHNTTFHKEGAERTRLQSLRQRAGRSLRTERSWRTKRFQRAQRALSTECLCPQATYTTPQIVFGSAQHCSLMWELRSCSTRKKTNQDILSQIRESNCLEAGEVSRQSNMAFTYCSFCAKFPLFVHVPNFH